MGGKKGKLEGGDNYVVLGVNKMAGFGTDDPSNVLLGDIWITSSLEDDINRGGCITDEMVVGWVEDGGGGEQEPLAEVAKQRVPLVTRSQL